MRNDISSQVVFRLETEVYQSLEDFPDNLDGIFYKNVIELQKRFYSGNIFAGVQQNEK
jgi:hypothetical protein